jgi:hypothetical protein
VITRVVQVETIRPFNPEGTSYGVTFRQEDIDGVNVPSITLVMVAPLSEAETMEIGGKYTMTLEEVADE